VGRLSEQKGHRFLLEAMRPVLASHPRARLLIAGDGHLRERLQEQAGPFGDRVAFLGIRDDVPALLARADLFVFPSLWEGQGNALLESLAVGPAIVATDIPSTRETVADGKEALLVPPTDPGALASAMLRVLDDPGLAARLAAGARVRVRDYDIERTTHDLEAVYARILG
jgi:glycosyltransferase involved in cell wall biosynthesis